MQQKINNQVKPIQNGFYKFMKLNGQHATVEYRSNLKSSTSKEEFEVDITPLLHSDCSHSAINRSLLKKVIHVTAVYGSANGKGVAYADWTLLNRTSLTQLVEQANNASKGKEEQAVSVKSLSVRDRLKAYEAAKADPNIHLVDDDGTNSDLPPEDNSDPRQWVD